jgi:hypothetical protein
MRHRRDHALYALLHFPNPFVPTNDPAPGLGALLYQKFRQEAKSVF